MLNNNRIVFLTLGLLLSPAGYVDDLDTVTKSTEQKEWTAPTKPLFVSQPIRLSDRPILTTSSALNEADEWLRPVTDFDFLDINELKRMSKLRSLSFLTLAEFRQTRLFLGVDTTGVVGLHFGGAPASHSDRHLEIARMPYLKKEKTDDASKSSKSDASLNPD